MDRREKFREGLHPFYAARYDILCKKLGEHWQPFSGERDCKTQNDLYALGRTKPGKKVTDARCGFSAHNFGCATDWTVWKNGNPIWPEWGDPIWKEYEEACWSAGLIWGKEFKDYPHNQLPLDCDWADIGRIYIAQGEDAARRAIDAHVY